MPNLITIVCVQCGKSFEINYERGKKPTLCSKECFYEKRNKDKRDRRILLHDSMDFVCGHCGKSFRPPQKIGHGSYPEYCSGECRLAKAEEYKQVRMDSIGVLANCGHCDKEFKSFFYHGKRQTFCSRECSREHSKLDHKELIIFNCRYCNKELKAYKTRLFCLAECKKKFVESNPQYSSPRKCSMCGEEKFLYDYSCHNEGDYIYFELFCNMCKYKNTPVKVKNARKSRNTAMRQKYGITHDLYDEILKKQDYKCGICRNDERQDGLMSKFHLDHCHKTGNIRGILCGKCNMAIGKLGDDSVSVYRAYVYLKNHEEENAG